jgi:hypothetical protein
MRICRPSLVVRRRQRIMMRQKEWLPSSRPCPGRELSICTGSLLSYALQSSVFCNFYRQLHQAADSEIEISIQPSTGRTGLAKRDRDCSSIRIVAPPAKSVPACQRLRRVGGPVPFGAVAIPPLPSLLGQGALLTLASNLQIRFDTSSNSGKHDTLLRLPARNHR